MPHFRFENLSLHKVGPFSLSMNISECIAISGASGSGKTLLLRACADLELHSGHLYLNDVEISEITPSLWRKQVSLLPAESQWWTEIVGDHFPCYQEQWLKSLGFDMNVLNWHVNRLSTGERQRLALLRLLANQPKVLLLDEPTANLDSENVIQMEKIIHQYRIENNASIIWVSHDPKQIKRIADHHYKIENGQLIKQETL